METEAPPGGTWGLTLVMVVIVSWLLYRYVAPKSWKEWTCASLVQAFIIALYAEMYGFPLTCERHPSGASVFRHRGIAGLSVSEHSRWSSSEARCSCG
jgi:hypothetical protein